MAFVRRTATRGRPCLDAHREHRREQSPLAERPLEVRLDATTGAAFLDESLKTDRHGLTAATAAFLEAADVAFDTPPLDVIINHRRNGATMLRDQAESVALGVTASSGTRA